MADIDYFQILKWVLIVLSAGFIGQFGKSFATYLLKKARSNRDQDTSRATSASFTGPPEEPKEEMRTPPSVFTERNKSLSKADKKAAKALIKLKKKEAK